MFIRIAKTTSSMIPSIKSASSTITSIARPTVAAYKVEFYYVIFMNFNFINF